MSQLNNWNTTKSIDHDNLNIIIRPRPPRRRQSGISLIPFRPYVKCLTSIREPFSFTDGKTQWRTMGKKEIFFKQENARCIGSFISDCHISDIIRWDIQGESTRLPMMCKLWMIVDGAVVERGKPHLVQDAAVQVYLTGRNHRSILTGEQRSNQIFVSTFNRRRRHSWHDVNEYHSVPYYQYTNSNRSRGYHQGIQCNMDDEYVTSKQKYLSFLIEETVDQNQFSQLEKSNAREIVHNQSILKNRPRISIITQTESKYINRSTEIDSDFIRLFNLNLQTNENLLSSIVNPYMHHFSSYFSWHTTRTIHKGIEYISRSVSTGDDYPQWWVQLSTNLILSDHITNQNEEKNIFSSPRQFHQSIQTDTESSYIQKSLSSIRINNNYKIIDQIDDGNNSRRFLPSHLNNYQIDDYNCLHRTTRSSEQFNPDSNILSLALNHQTYSTSNPSNIQDIQYHYGTHQTNRQIRRKTSENPSTTILPILLERYKRTLQERQRTTAIVNDQFLDIDDILKRYRQKIQNSDRTTQSYRDISTLLSQTKEENLSSSLSVARLTKSKYRTMPNLTSEEMLQCYIQSPRISITNSTLHSSRERQPRFDYSDICLIDHNTNSAWIRYNEQRIDQLQKRIDLMLEIDDENENQLILSSDTITRRINDIIMKKSKPRNQMSSYHNRILLPHRYNFRFPYRLNQSLPSSPRLLTRNLTRSTNPISKSVRISTDYNQTHIHKPSKINSQPIISVLRRNKTNLSPRSHRLVEASHVWKNENDGKVYILEQFSIPRYYRLYNDVSFREIYNFSRILQSYIHGSTPEHYSSIIKKFAVEQQLPTITNVG